MILQSFAQDIENVGSITKIMKHQELIEKILSTVGDENGFLVQLSAHLTFNEAQYREIFKLFSEYEEAIRDDQYIDRRVARFAVDMVTVLEGEAYQLGLRKHPDAEKTGHAHAEFLDLLYKLLP